ncbi:MULTISPECIES: sorbosone dehydrogenase family protein [unclassified Microbacterium]|uniref:PQQ-dependent sugar dehydrogenase n=1 Tax=unclassified Microbacterium TaxID=2609290 RepID=UPI0012FB628A|nr:PQQ-dependent sugar dehydrogenase [Microbacterium sp. MAH-37]MVQ43959.1 PQQ-dependent sugar dehydrogenase [Microbacterium sp. MAH-37]
MRSIRLVVAGTVLAALALSGCTAEQPANPVVLETPKATVMTLAQGLESPWSVVRLDDGSALISQRDDGKIIEVSPLGQQRVAGTVPGVVSGGEAGLNGLAVRDGVLYAYHATADDNRVVRMRITGEPGARGLDEPETVFDGIPRAANHDGGRIAFGPDGMLYIGTGDAGQRERAQDPDYLGGKILRITPDGDPAPGNPFGNAVYSLGHRNVQGIAWDADGTMWASEFGQNTWDELNRIEQGKNYGWPLHEGIARADGFVDPVVQWSPEEASPSGIAVIDGTVLVAGLRGERLWVVPAGGQGEASSTLPGDYGRLRDVVAGPDGMVWLLTNNTDGRGSPRDGDDRLLQLRFAGVTKSQGAGVSGFDGSASEPSALRSGPDAGSSGVSGSYSTGVS